VQAVSLVLDADSRRGHQHQTLDASGKGDGRLGRDEAAHRVAHQRRRLDAQDPAQIVEDLGVGADGYLLLWHRRVAKPGRSSAITR